MHRRRFERQNGEHVIDIGKHAVGAIFFPGPDARTNIIDDRQIRQRRADTFCHAMSEIRAVDDEQNVRLRGDDLGRCLADQAKQLRQPAQHLGDAHDRQFGKIEQGSQALGLQTLPADAD